MVSPVDRQIALLQQCEAFRNMSEAQVRQFNDLLRQETYASGSELMRQDVFSGRTFIILSGFVGIWRDGEQVNRCGPASFIGEIGLLTGQPATCMVQAEGKVTAGTTDGPTLMQFLKSAPTMKTNLVCLASERLRHAGPTDHAGCNGSFCSRGFQALLDLAALNPEAHAGLCAAAERMKKYEGTTPPSSACRRAASSHPLAVVPQAEQEKIAQLTKREKALIPLVAKGLSDGEIATSLGVSERTVRFHLSNLGYKLVVDDRLKLIAYCCCLVAISF